MLLLVMVLLPKKGGHITLLVCFIPFAPGATPGAML